MEVTEEMVLVQLEKMHISHSDETDEKVIVSWYTVIHNGKLKQKDLTTFYSKNFFKTNTFTNEHSCFFNIVYGSGKLIVYCK